MVDSIGMKRRKKFEKFVERMIIEWAIKVKLIWKQTQFELVDTKWQSLVQESYKDKHNAMRRNIYVLLG